MKKRYIITIFFIILILPVINNIFSYLRNQTEREYKTINRVPVTKTMARKLQTCSSYTQTYVNNPFVQFWTNSLGYKYYFKINGKRDGYCKIETYRKVFWLKTENKEIYNIPLGLAKYSGDILLAYANNEQYVERYIQFCKCAKKFYNSSDGRFSELTDYWKELDESNVKKELAYHTQEPKNDEHTCEQWKNKIDTLVKTPDFASLQNHAEKVSSELYNNHPKTNRQSGFGYNKKRQDGYAEFRTDYSTCKIKYNKAGVFEYKFNEIPIEERSDWAKFNTPKCWE